LSEQISRMRTSGSDRCCASQSVETSGEGI
jgi:hypothetical protein